MKKYFLPLFFCLVLIISCNKTYQAQTEYALGTYCTINLFESSNKKIYKEVFDKIHYLESILSVNLAQSNVSKINQMAGIADVLAEPETLEILDIALIYSEKSNGVLDPTVGPLVKLWNIGTVYESVPNEASLKNALSLIDFQKVKIDRVNQTVALETPNMVLDFGAIAKGYAADEVVKILKQHKVKRALIDLGGNVVAYGEKAKGQSWNVGIRDPLDDSGNPIAVIPVVNKSVVTSGVYERFFEIDGKRYHHILNTKTGYPVDNDIVSVTIVCESSTLADTLSTTVFALGKEEGLNLINTTPDTEVVFVFSNKNILCSSEIKNQIKILSSDYKIIQ